MIDNKTIRKVIMLNKMLPGGSPTYENREASGAIANFTTNTVQPFVSCECEILPIQEGTGTPSPSNPRPISGTSVLDIKHSGADTSDYDTTSVALGQTVYGGTADVVGGVGSKTHDLITLDGSEAWQVIASGANKRYILTLSDYTPNNAEISDIFGYLPTTTGNFGTFYFAQGILRIPDGNDTFATLADFKQWLSENAPSFVLQRTTPTDFTFTGQPIKSLLGTNNVWTDVGSTKVTYKYKTGEGGSSTKKYLPIFYDFYRKEKYHDHS